MNIHAIIAYLAIAALPLLFAITLHEVAHGWVASKLGDNTALMMGRLTLNPAKHISLFGTIILPIVLIFLGGVAFGWAKPVPITWQNLKNQRRDLALVAISGPLANLLMAVFWAMIAKLSIMGLQTGGVNSTFASALQYFAAAGRYGIEINAALFVLNLLPIPPLDGSRVLSSLLPRRLAYYYSRIEPYGLWILLGLLLTRLLYYVLVPPMMFLIVLISRLCGLPLL